MFEDALMESTGRIRSRKSWTTTISFTMQAAILIAVILMARFGPQTISVARIDMRLPAPPLVTRPATTPPVKLSQLRTSTVTNESPGPISASASRKFLASADGPAPATDFAAFTSSTGNVASNSAVVGLGPAAPVARLAGPARLRISSGTVQANCIACPPPLYPAAARAVHESGTVVLDALISATGTVEGLRVISGPLLLRQAAISAVRDWRYKPTILSGQPVEVQAEISVVFHFN